ncbi:TPA: winged helix-turn-helix transcriptional regulator [Stenotrophomonas maltophilia]|nr:winged helix-turn-helix transcriptional regulator [Stenotrophomonas maltophilia]
MEQSDPRTAAGNEVCGLIFTILRLNGRLVSAGDRIAGAFGLTSARWQILGAVAMSPSLGTVASHARTLGLTRQGVNRIVGELVEEGHLELKDNPNHRSAKLVLMTAAGQKALDSCMQAQAPWANEVSDGLSPGRIADAHKLLQDLLRRTDQRAQE